MGTEVEDYNNVETLDIRTLKNELEYKDSLIHP